MATGTPTAFSHGCEEVLVNTHAYVERRTNATTAEDFTRNGELIVASFVRRRPPQSSRLYIDSPDLDPRAFSEPPTVVRMVEGLILIRVAINCRRPKSILNEECDYFIYRPDPDRPRLNLLPHPAPDCFNDDEVGLLPRGGDRFAVAALLNTPEDPSAFTLRLFDSCAWSWASIKLTLQEPRRTFPVKIPRRANRLYSHETCTVITIGGEQGTMGWVDLWSGILLCDVLHPHPLLRRVPVPLPMEQLEFDGGNGMELGCPKPIRGITFIKEKGCLRLVELDIFGTRFQTQYGDISFNIHNWTITTWSNAKLTDSFDDWLEDCRPLDAKHITFSEPMRGLLLGYGLVQTSTPSPQDKEGMATGQVRNLENLWVYRPTPSMTDGNVIYLMAMAKFRCPNAFVLEINMETRKLQRIAYSGTKRELGSDMVFHHGSFSKNGRNPHICIVIDGDGNSKMKSVTVQQEILLRFEDEKDVAQDAIEV